MKAPTQQVKVLLVEDELADVLLLEEALGSLPGVEFAISHVTRLSQALERLESTIFDVVLLDLGLPDSNGIDTFRTLASAVHGLPIMVLTSNNDDTLGLEAVKLGAEDFLVKSQVQSSLLGRFIRFAVERHQLKRMVDQLRQRQAQERELTSIEAMSVQPRTTVTARFYSSEPLRESAAPLFSEIAARYGQVLDLALDRAVHKGENGFEAALHEISNDLGLLHAGPRDVIDLHVQALRLKTGTATERRAQAYLEEARLTVLELMGNLMSFYRCRMSGAAREGASEWINSH